MSGFFMLYRDYLVDVLYNAVTTPAIRLGTVLNMGWFWNRPTGCLALYSGESMESIDYHNPLSVTNSDSRQVQVPNWAYSQVNSANYYVVRRYNSQGYSEQSDVAAIKVAFDQTGDLQTPAANKVFEFTAMQVCPESITLQWYYNPLGQKVKPKRFNLCWDNGSGQIDYINPLAILDYYGRGLYSFTQNNLTTGRYLFAIFADDAAGRNSPPTRLEMQIKAIAIPQADIIDAGGL
jgi:hypothetical protein